jgi:hypothetical protein
LVPLAAPPDDPEESDNDDADVGDNDEPESLQPVASTANANAASVTP